MPKLVPNDMRENISRIEQKLRFGFKIHKKNTKFNVLQFYGVCLQNNKKKHLEMIKYLKVFATVCEIVLQNITARSFAKVSHVVF
jgi:hypothetical protein